MDARTTFDRETARARRSATAVGRVPLRDRTWFRLGGLAVLVGWVIACVYLAMQLAV